MAVQKQIALYIIFCNGFPVLTRKYNIRLRKILFPKLQYLSACRHYLLLILFIRLIFHRRIANNPQYIYPYIIL
mgnify:CR=1 FL=1